VIRCKRVVADKFVVQRPGEKNAAVLEVGKPIQGILSFRTNTEHFPLTLALFPGGSPVIRLASPKGDRRVKLTVLPDDGNASLELERNPSSQMSLEAFSDGLSALSMRAEGESHNIGLSVNNNGPHFALSDKLGKLRLSLATGSQGTGVLLFDGMANLRSSMHDRLEDTSLSFFDHRVRTRLELTRDAADGTRIRLLDPDRKKQQILR